MKIIINTSNLYVGGGVQVALSFINELKALREENQYHIFLSQAIAKQIDQENFPANFSFYLIEKSPASLKTRKSVVAKLDALEEQIVPDIVFSVFGPSYWRPKAKHLLGIADGWVYNPDSVAYERLPFSTRIKRRLHGKYKAYYFKKDADYYVVETEDAQKKLSNIVGLAKDHIFVVGNTYSAVFDEKIYMQEDNRFYKKLPVKQAGEFRLMYIAHNHPSKNIEVINELLPLLKEHNITFYLTLDNDSFLRLFPTAPKQVINLGPVPQQSCPSIYKQCDTLFAPTLLETFSAAYPEAMKMKKPILTSNYSFATDTCQEAALYFDPLDPNDIAEKIKKLAEDKVLQKTLVEKGTKRLKVFETARSRAEKYIEICKKMVKLN